MTYSLALANNEGLNVVPQLLTKNADEFVWAAGLLADLGYDEVNLNLGCPSGTVVSKGKGSGAGCSPTRPSRTAFPLSRGTRKCDNRPLRARPIRIACFGSSCSV